MWRQFKKMLLGLLLVGCGGFTSAYAVDTVRVEYLIPQPSQLSFAHGTRAGNACLSGGSVGWALFGTKVPYGDAYHMASYPAAGSEYCNYPLVWYIVPSACMFVSDATQATYSVTPGGPGQVTVTYTVAAASGSYSVNTPQPVSNQLALCQPINSNYQFVGCGQANDNNSAIECCWADGPASASDCGWKS